MARFRSTQLERSELALLERFRDRWLQVRMLDLGVGTGRTAYTFAPLVGEYVGIDYSPEMIDLARAEVPPAPHVRFEVGDARCLEGNYDGPWELVLFSFNGIGGVGHEERLDVLRQVRERLTGDGLFCFSAHSAHSLPRDKPALMLDPRRPLRSVYRSARALQERRIVKTVNAGVNPVTFDERGWDRLADGSHGFQERWYYVTVGEQLRQLEEAGFGAVEVLNNDAQPVDPANPSRDPWLHYFCHAG